MARLAPLGLSLEQGGHARHGSMVLNTKAWCVSERVTCRDDHLVLTVIGLQS